MSIMQRSHKQSQDAIFRSYNWWDKGCLLFQITSERCDYVQSRVEGVFGKGALAQQEVLEIGCGGGLICHGLALRQALTVGIDPSESALVAARAHAQQDNLGQNEYFERGYSEALPYADGSFSVIVCLDVLEHVNDLRKTLQEIERVLAPGGIFIFDTINRTLLARLVLIWIGERFFQKGGLIPGLHDYHKFIKPHELRSILTESGLQIRELTGFMPRGIKNGQVKLSPGWFMGISYIGYATKGR